MEVWKDIKGFEGIYQISSHGRIKSFKKNKKGYILSNRNKNGWYLNVVLTSKDNWRSVKIHRLVAESFIPNPDNKPEVNHKDGDKQNNKVENLEWVTESENMNHAINMNPNIVKGMNHYNKYSRPKTVQQFNFDGELMAEYPNCKLASEITGVCQRNIHAVAAQEEYKPGLTRSQAGGFVWRFKEEEGDIDAS